MGATVSTRMPESEIREIERLAKEEDLDKSAFVKRLIHKGLEKHKIEYAFRLYKERKISAGRAAEIAGVSLWRLFDLMEEYGVTLNCSVEDFDRELENVR